MKGRDRVRVERRIVVSVGEKTGSVRGRKRRYLAEKCADLMFK